MINESIGVKRAKALKKKRVVKQRGKLSFDEKREAFSRVGLLSEVEVSVLPAGIDKVFAEVVLSKISYDSQLQAASGQWKERKRPTGESYYTHTVQDKKGNELFYFQLYRSIRPHSVTQKGTDSWLLLIRFNPSRFAYLRGAEGAVQGENYVAGNSVDYEVAMKELEKILQSDVFNKLETIERKPLDVWAAKLTQPHLARDYRLHPLHLKFRRKFGWHDSQGFWERYSQATWENEQVLRILGLFSNSSPHKRVDAKKSTEYTLLEDHLKDLKRKSPKRYIGSLRRRDLRKLKKVMADGHNPLGSPINCVTRKILTRHDELYVKERYNKAHRFQGAAPRLELKLLKTDGIKLLGVKNLADLYHLQQEVDAWHQGGRVGEIPLIERLLNERLQKLNKPLTETRDKAKLRFIPTFPLEFIDFVVETEKEVHVAQKKAGSALGVELTISEADHSAFLARLEEMKTHILDEQPLDFVQRETIVFCLTQGLKILKPLKVHQIMGRISGFLDYQNKPTLIEAARERHDNLRVLFAYLLNFYDGDFFGFSKFEERELVIEYLVQKRICENDSEERKFVSEPKMLIPVSTDKLYWLF